jgi:hypothetical protein
MGTNKSIDIKTSTGIIILLMILGVLIFPTLPTIIAAIVLWSLGDNYLDSSARLKNKSIYLSKLKTTLPLVMAIFSIVGLVLSYMGFYGSAQGPLIGIIFVGPLSAFIGLILFFAASFIIL